MCASMEAALKERNLKDRKVQGRATRMMMRGEVLEYDIRLRKVGLATLETVRLRADML